MSPRVALTASKQWMNIIGDKIIIKNDDFQNYQYSESSLIYRINLHRAQLSIPSNPINFLIQSISSYINLIETNSFDYRIFELVMSNIKEEKWADNSIKDERINRYRRYGWTWKKIATIYKVSPSTARRWSMA